MTTNRIRRAWPCLMGAAILGAPMLGGCGAGDQSTGVKDDVPKESPVLSSKDSMQDFMKNRNAQKGQAAKK